MRMVSLLIILGLVVGVVMPARGEPDGWVAIADGIAYQEFHLADPNNVYVARMETANPNVTIQSSLASGALVDGAETVSNQAYRYNQSVNTWGGTWGNRSRVAVAINGYFYDASGLPWRGQVEDGWYIKRFDKLENGSGFAWKSDRSAFIGECITHPETKQFVTYEDGYTQVIAGINVPRGTNQLVMYTPQYGTHTPSLSSGVEVLVEMEEPAGIQPTPDNAAGTVRFKQTFTSAGSTIIPYGHVVLSATGAAATYLKTHAAKDEGLGISQFIKHYDKDNCSTLISLDWHDTYASIGSSFYFLENGVIDPISDDPQATTRAPRTAIAMNENYIFFIVVDGRSPLSVGMTMQELGNFAKNTLGATHGVNQDGGGSSTMVINGVVKNFPNYETGCYADYSEQLFLPLVVGPTSAKAVVHDIPMQDRSYATWEEIDKTTDGKCERAVGNGMMMVVVEPKIQSTMFQPLQAVVTLLPTEIRQGPGINYPALGQHPCRHARHHR